VVNGPVRAILCLSVLYSFCSATATAQSAGQPLHQLFAGTGRSAQNESPYRSGQPAGTANAIKLGNPFGIEIGDQALWITTVDDHCIYRGKLDGSALIRIAGSGVNGYSGDGGPAVEATFNWPHEVRADRAGNLFVADTRNHVIRRIDASSGIITTLAGSGEQGFAGDGSSGDQVQFKHPHSVVLDGAGGLLVADTANHRLRRIDLSTGKVETISGTGRRELPTDGEDARQASLFGPRSLAVDADSIWIALREGNSIWRIERATNKIHHVAGTGKKGYSGDGGPPREATFSGPKGLVMDGQRRLLVVDTENHALRRIDLDRDVMETVLGGTLAKQSFVLKRPHGIDYAASLGYLIADSENHRVLRGTEP
jgi:sugar lactone lactonase YvrE